MVRSLYVVTAHTAAVARAQDGSSSMPVPRTPRLATPLETRDRGGCLREPAGLAGQYLSERVFERLLMPRCLKPSQAPPHEAWSRTGSARVLKRTDAGHRTRHAV